MLFFKKISMKNFFSFGNVPQVLELDNSALTLILGQNNDALSTDGAEGARNGVGKSAIIQGLTYGLYGKSIDNSIKIPNLVNKINEKHCEVKIEFEKDGISYRVERGRSPTFFNFYKNDNIVEVDESRGEMKDTQEELIEVLGISQTLFEHIVVLNTNVLPFLALSTSKQRDMIEELLGITQLTEKATLLKDMYKETKRLADQEKFRLDTVYESNKKIEQSISALEEQAANFELHKEKKIKEINSNLEQFKNLNWNELMETAVKCDSIIVENKKIDDLKRSLSDLMTKRTKYDENIKSQKNAVLKSINELKNIDINEELAAHENVKAWEELNAIHKELSMTSLMLNSKIITIQQYIKNSTSKLEKENAVLISLTDIDNAKCPMCEQRLEHTDSHESMLQNCKANIDAITAEIKGYTDEIGKLNSERPELFDMPPKPSTHYPSVAEAKLHEHKLSTLEQAYVEEGTNPYDSDIIEVQSTLDTMEYVEVPQYIDISSISMLQFQETALKKDLERENASTNPYFPQIEVLKNNSLQILDYDEYNRLVSTYEHQDFLTKLLTNKDSFVRKRIIDQNIQFLNKRLSYYIEKSGSNHNVEFMNDLSVDISMNGKSYDYSQLSRGERNRIIISLNLAFRDTYESLYQNVNILFVDEIIDNGLDSNGVYSAWSILQDLSATRNKNIYVVSHREELLSKAASILKVLKEDSFSTIEFCTSEDF